MSNHKCIQGQKINELREEIKELKKAYDGINGIWSLLYEINGKISKLESFEHQCRYNGSLPTLEGGFSEFKRNCTEFRERLYKRMDRTEDEIEEIRNALDEIDKYVHISIENQKLLMELTEKKEEELKNTERYQNTIKNTWYLLLGGFLLNLLLLFINIVFGGV